MEWNSDRAENGLFVQRLQMTPEEAKMFQPIVKKELHKCLLKQEKYRDILESGEANERQQDQLAKYNELVEFYRAFIIK